MKNKFEYTVMADHIRIAEWFTENRGAKIAEIYFADNEKCVPTKTEAIERAEIMVNALNEKLNK